MIGGYALSRRSVVLRGSVYAKRAGFPEHLVTTGPS
jgi:hypothetical protein